MADVVGHLQDIEETFKGLRSFCKAETRIIISYYNFFWEPVLKVGEWLRLKMPQQYQNWLSSEDICNFQNWLSSEDICNLLTLAHFQVVKAESRLLIPYSQVDSMAEQRYQQVHRDSAWYQALVFVQVHCGQAG